VTAEISGCHQLALFQTQAVALKLGFAAHGEAATYSHLNKPWKSTTMKNLVVPFG